MKKAMMVIKEQEILGKDFKVYGTADEPLFLAKNVAEWIGYSKSGNGSYHLSMMVKTVDPDEKMKATILVGGQNRDVLFLTEDGLYEVLMQSRMSIARQFKKEVKKILKSIRKDGGYIKGEDEFKNGKISEDEFILKAMKMLSGKVDRISKERDDALKLANDKQKQINITIDCEGTFSWAETSQIISSNGFEIGRNKLTKALRGLGIIKKNNTPYSKNAKYFDVIMKVVNRGSRSDLVPTTRVYGKGIDFIFKQLVKDAEIV